MKFRIGVSEHTFKNITLHRNIEKRQRQKRKRSGEMDRKRIKRKIAKPLHKKTETDGNNERKKERERNYRQTREMFNLIFSNFI